MLIPPQWKWLSAERIYEEHDKKMCGQDSYRYEIFFNEMMQQNTQALDLLEEDNLSMTPQSQSEQP